MVVPRGPITSQTVLNFRADRRVKMYLTRQREKCRRKAHDSGEDTDSVSEISSSFARLQIISRSAVAISGTLEMLQSDGGQIMST
jgi:hypothetical protein